MQLIGYLDSPFVRRVAITLQFLGIVIAWRFMQKKYREGESGTGKHTGKNNEKQ